MTAATGDPSPWPAADIRISTLPYELLARVIFHARACYYCQVRVWRVSPPSASHGADVYQCRYAGTYPCTVCQISGSRMIELRMLLSG